MKPGKLEEQPMPEMVATSCCGNLELDEGLLDGGEDAVVAAAGTPVGLDAAFEVGHGDCVGGDDFGRHLDLLGVR